MLEVMDNKFKVILEIISAVFVIIDTVTDGLILVNYWNAGEYQVFVASTVILVVTLPLSFAVLILQAIELLRKQEKYKEMKKLASLLETMTGSVPQLILKLVFLSRCTSPMVPTTQYVAIFLSCLSISYEMFSFEGYGHLVHDKKCKKYVELFILFFCKLVYVVSRVLAVAFFSVFFKFWILLVFAVRWVFWLLANFCLAHPWKEYALAVFIQTLVYVKLGTGAQTVLSPLYSVIENCFLVGFVYAYREVYPGGNETAAVIQSNVTTASGDIIDPMWAYCLYDHVLATNAALNATVIMLAILCYYIIHRKVDSEGMERLT